MTKSILIERLCETCKVPAARAEHIVNTIFDAIEHGLARGQRIEIRGFGSFEVREYAGYVGRNPRTGSQVAVKAKRLPFFKVGKELKDRVEQAGSKERASQAPDSAAASDAKARPNPTSTSTSLHEAPLGAV